MKRVIAKRKRARSQRKQSAKSSNTPGSRESETSWKFNVPYFPRAKESLSVQSNQSTGEGGGSNLSSSVVDSNETDETFEPSAAIAMDDFENTTELDDNTGEDISGGVQKLEAVVEVSEELECSSRIDRECDGLFLLEARPQGAENELAVRDENTIEHATT